MGYPKGPRGHPDGQLRPHPSLRHSPPPLPGRLRLGGRTPNRRNRQRRPSIPVPPFHRHRHGRHPPAPDQGQLPARPHPDRLREGRRCHHGRRQLYAPFQGRQRPNAVVLSGAVGRASGAPDRLAAPRSDAMDRGLTRGACRRLRADDPRHRPCNHNQTDFIFFAIIADD